MRLERLIFVVSLAACVSGAAVAGTSVLAAEPLALPAPAPPPTRSTRPPREQPLDRLAYGVEFARVWKAVDGLPVDVRFQGWNLADREHVLAYADVLPPPVLRVLSDYGGRVICFEGSLTDQPECHDLRGVRCGLYASNDITYDTVSGVFRARMKTAFARVDRDPASARRTVLHELGHMLDDALGKRSQMPEFYAALDSDDAGRDLGYPERIAQRHRRAIEYYAVSFAMYMGGDVWRRLMRGTRPAAAAYWDDVMAELAAAHHERTEIATRRVLRRR